MAAPVQLSARVLDVHTHLPSQHHAALLTVKNIAYAWRQALYLLSFCDLERQTATAHRFLEATTSSQHRRLQPVADGLIHVIAGGRFTTAGIADGGIGRRLLGWSMGEHWLLEPAAPPR